jgi:hypothetical protein
LPVKALVFLATELIDQEWPIKKGATPVDDDNEKNRFFAVSTMVPN